jgi:hypothetical protein
MQEQFVPLDIAVKPARSLGVGLLICLEREWSREDLSADCQLRQTPASLRLRFFAELHCFHTDLRDGWAGRQAVSRTWQCICDFRSDRLEREIRHKSAGLRAYTVVGTAAALFLLISKYGFINVLADGLVVLDPSRVAADRHRNRLYRSGSYFCAHRLAAVACETSLPIARDCADGPVGRDFPNAVVPEISDVEVAGSVHGEPQVHSTRRGWPGRHRPKNSRMKQAGQSLPRC